MIFVLKYIFFIRIIYFYPFVIILVFYILLILLEKYSGFELSVEQSRIKKKKGMCACGEEKGGFPWESFSVYRLRALILCSRLTDGII